MGACFNSMMIRAKDGLDLRAKLRAEIEQIEHQYGHDSYNGQLSTCSGLKTHINMKFKTRRKAEEWIEERAEKREEMIAVRCSQTPKKYNHSTGEWVHEKKGNWWVIGGLCGC
jgi:spore cortex formation protein SpoVR/YcgB (stage V sporulation)